MPTVTKNGALVLILALFLLLIGCSKADEAPLALDTTATEGTLAVGIAYGFHEYTCEEGISYGIAAKWEMRPVGKVSINFSAPESNTCFLRMELTDSESRFLGATGLLAPGMHITVLQLVGIPAQTDEICITVRAYDEDGNLLRTVSHHETLIRTYE